jgi:hypothetical protein
MRRRRDLTLVAGVIVSLFGRTVEKAQVRAASRRWAVRCPTRAHPASETVLTPPVIIWFVCDRQMYDLLQDPLESSSTHGDPQYDDAKAYMESRIPTFWLSAVGEPDFTDNPGKDVILKQWDNCQSTCPWSLNTASYDIEHKFSYPKAPHIVFILVDDWGYNDVGYRSTSMKWTTPTIDRYVQCGHCEHAPWGGVLVS